MCHLIPGSETKEIGGMPMLLGASNLRHLIPFWMLVRLIRLRRAGNCTVLGSCRPAQATCAHSCCSLGLQRPQPAAGWHATTPAWPCCCSCSALAPEPRTAIRSCHPCCLPCALGQRPQHWHCHPEGPPMPGTHKPMHPDA